MTQNASDTQSWRDRAEAMLAEAPLPLALPKTSRRPQMAKLAITAAAGVFGAVAMLLWSGTGLSPSAAKFDAKAPAIQTTAMAQPAGEAAGPSSLQMSFALSAPSTSAASAETAPK
jgi:hypothetical protein